MVAVFVVVLLVAAYQHKALLVVFTDGYGVTNDVFSVFSASEVVTLCLWWRRTVVRIGKIVKKVS